MDPVSSLMVAFTSLCVDVWASSMFVILAITLAFFTLGLSSPIFKSISPCHEVIESTYLLNEIYLTVLQAMYQLIVSENPFK